MANTRSPSILAEAAPGGLFPPELCCVPQPAPPPHALPRPGEAHVWLADLSTTPTLDALSPAERARGARFKRDDPRLQFTASRAVLRALLARYLGQAPGSFEIPCISGEKPALPAPAPLHFSYSHTDGLALIAFTTEGAVGVDVERLGADRDFAGVAKRYFTPEEHAAFDAAPPGRQEETFLNLWTAKEALLKATGEGLRGLERAHLAGSADRGLQLHSFRPVPGYIAAIATQGPKEIRFFHVISA